MLVKTVTYKNIDETEEYTEDFYFSLTQTRIVKLELSEDGGLEAFIDRATKHRNGQDIMDFFERMLRLSIGRKSEDGKRFIQNDEITNEFMQSNAYEVVFKELVMDAEAAAKFITGIMPSDIKVDAAKAMAQATTMMDEKMDLEKPAPRIVTRAELDEMPKEELIELSEKIATGEVVVDA